MRFNFPSEASKKKMYSLTKKLYKNDFYGFIKGLGQRTFFITSDSINCVCVIDDEYHKIDIFVGDEGFYTCHNFFGGDVRSLANYGYNVYTILEMSNEEIDDSYFNTYINNYKLYRNGDKAVCWISELKGQIPFIVNEKECNAIICALEYLFHIQGFFKSEGEEIPQTDQDLVCVFEFDDENMMYYSSYELLEKFSFVPKSLPKPTKNRKIIEALKDTPIKSGTLYIGNIFGRYASENYEYSNNVMMPLTNVLLYCLTEDGQMTYELYNAHSKEFKSKFDDVLIKSIKKIGLYDTIITDNLIIYNRLVKNLKEFGIEVQFDTQNPYNFVISEALIRMFSIFNNNDEIHNILDDVSKNYLEAVDAYNNYEEDDEIIEEVEDEDFDDFDDFSCSTNPLDIC